MGHFEGNAGMCRAYYGMFREKDKGSGSDQGGLGRKK